MKHLRVVGENPDGTSQINLPRLTLLDEVDDILAMPVGKTNLRQYIRTKRNKLATHGTLEFDRQDKKAQEVIEDPEVLEQYCQAMHSLDIMAEDSTS